MRKTVSLIFLLFLCCTLIYSQSLSAIDTGKYRIDLPPYWKKGNKIWSILNDKLPLVCEELKNKELCGDGCNPKYVIAYEMTRPVISDRYLTRTNSADSSESWKTVYGNNFSFRASLLLINNDGQLLTKFIIVDTTEVWPLYAKNTSQPKPQTITQRIADPVRTTATEGIQASSRDPLPIYNRRDYVIYKYDDNPKKGKQGPSDDDLFTIVNKKIKAWE